MRLLHTSTLEFEEFEGSNIPAYAILSHRWEGDEVTFQEMRSLSGENHGATRRKSGFDKIEQCCHQASRHGLKYAWIDTCCIDKSSSAELSEAINSMYQWYQNSAVCYAYLSDVEPKNVYENFDLILFIADVTSKGREKQEALYAHIAESKWWTRGWTLQELIAPSNLEFYGKDTRNWIHMGDKILMLDVIVSRTGITQEVLRGLDIGKCSIAMRMSWASDRETTRVEDMAYCLLGIFGVNMPLLYGEGMKAFLRLQEEIMKQSDDQTLFGWNLSPNDVHALKCGPLATAPSQFRNSGDLVPVQDSDIPVPYSMTNKGLRIELPIIEKWRQQRSIAILQCSTKNTFPERIALPIVRANIDERSQYARDGSYTYPLTSIQRHEVRKATKKTIFMRQNPEWRTIGGTRFRARIPYELRCGAIFPMFMKPEDQILETVYARHMEGDYFAPDKCRGGALALAGDGFTAIVLFNIEINVDRLSCKVLTENGSTQSLNMSQRRDDVEEIAARFIDDMQKRLEPTDTMKTMPSGRSVGKHLLHLWNLYVVDSSSRNSFSDLSNGGAVYANISTQDYRGQRTVVLNIEILKNKDGRELVYELTGNTSWNAGIGASLNQPPQYDR